MQRLSIPAGKRYNSLAAVHLQFDNCLFSLCTSKTHPMPLLKPLSGSAEAPQQHKQPSRKGKKAWRKNVDVSEVTEGLDALNKEIIRGLVATF